jgi:DNA-binding NarL/FixJ family response regulator
VHGISFENQFIRWEILVTIKVQPQNPIQVFLLIENRLMREALVRLFRKRSDVCVVGDRALGTEPCAPDTLGDVVVLDDPQRASVLGASLRNSRHEGTTVGLVLVGMEEEEDQFLAAVRTGVSGFLLNDASAGEIVAAVLSVARGEAVCPPRLCNALIRYVARSTQEAQTPIRPRPGHGLTIRQQQLVSLVAKGLTNKEIASQLNLSEFTIKNHMHRIMKQVEAETRHEAVEAVRASGYNAIA